MGVRKALTGARPQAALNPAHLSVPPGQMFHREMEALDQTLAGWSTSCTSPRPVLSCQLSASFSVPSGHPCPSIISHTSVCLTAVCRKASWQWGAALWSVAVEELLVAAGLHVGFGQGNRGWCLWSFHSPCEYNDRL